MKKITLLILLAPLFSKAQTFFVEENAKGLEQPIIEKLLDLGYKIKESKDSADYTVKPSTMGIGMAVKKGIIYIYDKSGDLVSKSKPVKGSPAIWNGYKGGDLLTIKRIAEKQLPGMIEKLKK